MSSGPRGVFVHSKLLARGVVVSQALSQASLVRRQGAGRVEEMLLHNGGRITLPLRPRSEITIIVRLDCGLSFGISLQTMTGIRCARMRLAYFLGRANLLSVEPSHEPDLGHCSTRQCNITSSPPPLCVVCLLMELMTSGDDNHRKGANNKEGRETHSEAPTPCGL